MRFQQATFWVIQQFHNVPRSSLKVSNVLCAIFQSLGYFAQNPCMCFRATWGIYRESGGITIKAFLATSLSWHWHKQKNNLEIGLGKKCSPWRSLPTDPKSACSAALPYDYKCVLSDVGSAVVLSYIMQYAVRHNLVLFAVHLTKSFYTNFVVVVVVVLVVLIFPLQQSISQDWYPMFASLGFWTMRLM